MNLLFDDVFKRRAAAATQNGKARKIRRRQGPDQDLVGPHEMSGIPPGIAIVGSPLAASASGSTSASTFPHAVP